MQIGIPVSFPVLLYVALLGISAQAEDTSFAHAKCIQKGFQENTNDYSECMRQFLKSIGSLPKQIQPVPKVAAPAVVQSPKVEAEITLKAQEQKHDANAEDITKHVRNKASTAQDDKRHKDSETPKPTDDKARKELEASKAAQEKLRKELEAAKAAEEKLRKELEATKATDDKQRKYSEAAKAAQEKQRKESEAAMAELEQRLKAKAEQAQSEKMRKDQLERTMMQGAGVGRGVQSAPPSTPPSTPPSAEYGTKVREAVRPHLLLIKEVNPNLTAEYLVRTDTLGNIISAKLTKTSGDAYFDDAAYTAIWKTERLPKDKDGKVPSPMVIVISP
jgi:colicin import membrane protein